MGPWPCRITWVEGRFVVKRFKIRLGDSHGDWAGRSERFWGSRIRRARLLSGVGCCESTFGAENVVFLTIDDRYWYLDLRIQLLRRSIRSSKIFFLFRTQYMMWTRCWVFTLQVLPYSYRYMYRSHPYRNVCQRKAETCIESILVVRKKTWSDHLKNEGEMDIAHNEFCCIHVHVSLQVEQWSKSAIAPCHIIRFQWPHPCTNRRSSRPPHE